MKNTSMGSMHPVLFFVALYAVALFFAIFICSSLFYSCNASHAPEASKEKTISPAPNRAATIALNK